MTAQARKKLNKISLILSCGVFALSILLFWAGLDLLKTEVFPHYYNPEKHVIVQQNPDTKEIYAWKDDRGMVYTADDSQVKNFTWGTTALILLVMVFGSGVYSLAVKHATRLILESDSRAGEGYLTGLQ